MHPVRGGGGAGAPAGSAHSSAPYHAAASEETPAAVLSARISALALGAGGGGGAGDALRSPSSFGPVAASSAASFGAGAPSSVHSSQAASSSMPAGSAPLPPSSFSSSSAAGGAGASSSSSSSSSSSLASSAALSLPPSLPPAGGAPGAPPRPPGAPLMTGPCVIFLRHSERLDKLAEGSEARLALERAHPRECAWPDRHSRPYDTPIFNFEMPRERALELQAILGGVPPVIISSPFRRTLQTAGIVARVLGVPQVLVDHSLSEDMVSVKKRAPAYVPLGVEQMRLALGEGVSLFGVVGSPPSIEETPAECKRRFQARAAAGMRDSKASGRSTLFVSHCCSLNHVGAEHGRWERSPPCGSWICISTRSKRTLNGGGGIFYPNVPRKGGGL